MNRRSAIIIISILVVLGILLVVMLWGNDDKSYYWYENYNATSDEPYGTSFISELIQKQTKNGEFILLEKKPFHQVVTEKKIDENASYIFIGNTLHMGDKDKEAFFKFVAKGNEALIASYEIPEIITDLYDRECNTLMIKEDNRTKDALMNFYHPTLFAKYGYKYTYREETTDMMYNWRTFNSGLFCESSENVTPLGYIEPEKVNFLKFKHGQGTVYLHSNPIVFTNYFLIKKEKAEYASSVLSHLDGRTIIYDEFGKIPVLGGEGQSNNPLSFIMRQPALKYAWWMVLISVLLYVAFAAKRTQRVIPVLEEKTNTSLEFVKLISALHLKSENHLEMARKKMKYFQYFIRSRYGIHIQPLTEEVVNKISDKSKVPLHDVKAIFNLNKLIEEGSGGAIESTRLSNFYHAIENFYKHCK